MNNRMIGFIAAALALGIGGGFWAGSMQPEKKPEQAAASIEKRPLHFRNPMNPAITSPVPAKDEMGMDYIPVYANSGNNVPAGTVSIDSVVSQNIGVRSTIAEKKTLTRNIHTVGRVDFDEKRVTRLHPKVEGWVEKLFVDTTGALVRKDTMLLSLYSPQLVSSEEEFLLAIKNAETLKNSPFPDIRQGAESLARSSRERLELLDVPAHQIRDLEQHGKIIKNLHIHSPFDGAVIEIGAREGQHVTPATELYKIADLSRVWVYVDVYEDEVPWVRTGDMGEIQVASVPGRTFTGRVSYIYPYLDAKTRTNKVRLEFANPDLLLKPDMFANVVLKSSRQIEAVVVPSEAIVRTGNREQVFVVREAGKFEPREVRLGISADGETQILEGVNAGEQIVTSAQFLIDSESKLNEATAKMLEAANQQQSPSSDTEMDGMKMEEKGK